VQFALTALGVVTTDSVAGHRDLARPGTLIAELFVSFWIAQVIRLLDGSVDAIAVEAGLELRGS
jgi:hypothetical protein